MTPSETNPVKPFKRMDDEPVFDEPWQAQVLAMADTLIVNGVISAAVWSDTLGNELKKAQSTGAADDITTYYKAALQALEQLLDQYANIHESCESIPETSGSDGCPEANPAEGRERMPLDNAPLSALIIGTLNLHSKGASR